MVEDIHCVNTALKPLLGSKSVSNNSKEGDFLNTNMVPLRNLAGKTGERLSKDSTVMLNKETVLV